MPSESSGVPPMRNSADGVYNQRPWELTSQTLEQYRRQDSDRDIAPEANARAVMDSAIYASENPRAITPPRFGWSNDQLTLDDIMRGIFSRIEASPALDSGYMDDFSGGNAGYGGQGTSNTPGLGEIPQGL